jgi:uncharacterized protein
VALPLVNVVIIGARDIDRLRAFYEDLGWPLIADGDPKLFGLRGGALALFPAGRLAEDARAEIESTRGGVRFALEVLVEEREQVDALARRVESAGGRITKAPVDAESFEGRSCYFADPEDSYFEIAWAPSDNIVVAAARRAAARA